MSEETKLEVLFSLLLIQSNNGATEELCTLKERNCDKVKEGKGKRHNLDVEQGHGRDLYVLCKSVAPAHVSPSHPDMRGFKSSII